MAPLLFLFILFCSVLQSTPVSADGNRSYASPISKALCDEMIRHRTLMESNPVGCQRLSLVKFSYFGFDGQTHDDGEIVVMDAVADHIAKIFDALLARHFPLQKAQLLNRYDGDDEASMSDNNSSAFNDRPISGGSSLSMHAYGLAVDVNPVQNPFVQHAGRTLHVSPKQGEGFLDRTTIRPGMTEDIVDIFADNGFPIWGGDWHNPTDYQHFQTSRELAERLARASSSNAKMIFEGQVEQYHRCRQAGRSRRACTAGART